MILLLISGTVAAGLAIISEIVVASAGLSFGTDITYWAPDATGTQVAVFIAGIFLLAAVEEAIKFTVLRTQLLQLPTASTILPSLLFGTGFATVEIWLLLGTAPDLSVSFVPSAGIAAIHLLTTLAYGLIPPNAPRVHAVIALLIGIGAHAFYNMFLALI